MGYDTFELRVRERTLDGRQFGRVTVTVTALVDEDGTALNEIRDTDGNIILSGSATVTATGASTNDVTVFLPDPRDVTLIPTGFGYQVQVVADSVTKPSVIFGPDEITSFGVGGVLYLEDITPVGGVTFTGTGSYATTADLAAEAALRTSGDTARLQKALNLSDVASAATSRTNLGLGAAATKAVGTTTGTVAAGDDSRFTVGGGVSIDTVTIYAGDHGTLDPTGITDNSAILQACYTQARTALSSGAKAVRIVFPAGTFRMLTPEGGGFRLGALAIRANHTGMVSLEGQGTAATVFKMTNTCPQLITVLSADLDAANTFQNLTLRDFTVDRNNSAIVNNSVIIGFAGVNLNASRVLIERVNAINMGTPNPAVAAAAIYFDSLGGNTWNRATQTRITDITVRSCRLGKVNGVGTGGGNYGVIFQAFNSGMGTSLQKDSDIVAGGTNANVFIDNITVEDVIWDSGITSFNGVTGGNSAGFMFGSGGMLGRLRVTDCKATGSVDVGYEIDSCYDAILTRCVAEDSMNVGFYHRPNFAGLPNVDAYAGASLVPYDRARFALIDCTARSSLQSSVNSGTISSSSTVAQGFGMHAKDFGIPAGHVTIRNFSYYLDGPQALYATGPLNKVIGGFRSVDIDRLSVSVNGVALDSNWSFGPTTRALSVAMRNGRGKFRLRDLQFHVNGSNNLTGGNIFTLNTLQLDNLADYQLDIEGVHSRINVTGTPPQLTEINLGQNNNNDSDTFRATTDFTQGWRSDLNTSGQSTANFTVSSNTLSVTSPGTTEYRLTQVKDESQTNYDYGQVGPVTDGNTTMQCRPPTAPTASYKQGVRLKVDGATGTNSVHAYVNYDGANYNLRIDTEVAGTLTNRATTSLGAAVTTPFYVRGKVIGDVVTAEYLTAAPTSATAPAATTSTTFTLNSGDGTLALFGGLAPQGWPGIVWVPVDSGSNTKTVNSYFQSVVSGRIARMAPLLVVGTAIAKGLTSGNATPSNILRLRGTLELPEWDIAPYAVVGIAGSGMSITEAATLQKIRATRWNHYSPPAAAAITPGASPYTYTNQDGYDEDIAIYGGTVSAVSVTRVGGSASQVSDSTGRIVRLAPGESVTVTYSVVPTMRKTPV